jgi:pimeloyl-ACP methyl ester carboxylesterase
MRAQLAVKSYGRGEPLVLLHGIATDSGIWANVVPELARRHQVITVDLPGFGGSAPVGPGFDLAEVADRIRRGLVSRGISGPIDLVGHSLGGGVAITLGATRPRAIRRMILVAPAGLRPFPSAIAELISSGADAVLRARRRAAPLAENVWGRRLLLALTAADGAEVPPLLAKQMVEASASALRTPEAMQAITRADLRPLLARTTVPLGVIWGEADLTVPIRALADLTEARPDAFVVRLAGAGHVPMIERPVAFTEALFGLLDTLPVPDRGLLRDDTSSSGREAIVP